MLARVGVIGSPEKEGMRDKKEDTGISARCLPEGRKCAVARAFRVCLDILFSSCGQIERADASDRKPIGT